MKSNSLLLIGIVVVAALLISFSLLLGYQSFRSTQAAVVSEFNQRQLTIAIGAARGIEQYADTLVSTMQVMGEDAGVKEFDKEESRHLLEGVFRDIKNQGVINIGIVDAEGILRFVATSPELEGTNFSNREFFKESKTKTASNQYEVELIDPKDKYAGDKGVAIAVPFFEYPDNSKSDVANFIGVIYIIIKLDNVYEKFIDPIHSSAQGHAYLIDKRFNILWAPDRSLFGKNFLEEAVRFPKFQRVIKKMTSGKSGIEDYVFFKFESKKKKFSGGVNDYIIAYTPVSFGNRQWSIGVWAPINDALELTESSFRRLAMVVGSVVFVVIFASFVAFISITRSTEILRKSEENFRHIALVLQDSFIKPIPDIPELDIWFSYKTAHETEKIGGDFCDVFKIGDDKVIILIGDVAGKGVEAACYTETVRSSVRSLALINHSPSFIMEQTNKAFVPQVAECLFVTATLALIDLKNSDVTFVSAGHPPPVIFNEKPFFMDLPYNCPLGSFKDEKYSEIKIKFEEDNCILMYTDGLTEARRGSNFFGEEKVIETLREIKIRKSKEMVERLLDEAAEFTNGKFSDDIAVVAVIRR